VSIYKKAAVAPKTSGQIKLGKTAHIPRHEYIAEVQ
jgi:hypothetical protein